MSGAQLALYTGIAATLRQPLNEVDADAASAAAEKHLPGGAGAIAAAEDSYDEFSSGNEGDSESDSDSERPAVDRDQTIDLASFLSDEP